MITKAIIRSYDSGTHTVAVQPVGSLGTFWKNIKVAANIPAGDCTVGNYCAVASFNDSNPTEIVWEGSKLGQNSRAVVLCSKS